MFVSDDECIVVNPGYKSSLEIHSSVAITNYLIEIGD